VPIPHGNQFSKHFLKIARQAAKKRQARKEESLQITAWRLLRLGDPCGSSRLREKKSEFMRLARPTR